MYKHVYEGPRGMEHGRDAYEPMDEAQAGTALGKKETKHYE